MEDLSAFSARPRLAALLDHFAKVEDTRQAWKGAATITTTSSIGAPQFPARLCNPGASGREPVSVDIRTRLCSGAGIPPGKSFARPETAAAFLATPADFGRQRP